MIAKVFIATGQGLEGVLAGCFFIASHPFSNFATIKQGQYAQGINDGLNQIIAASKRRV